MIKFWKFFQYAYLVFAVVFIIESIARWNTDRSKAYIFIAFAFLAIFMYFFRKRFSKRFEDRNNNQRK